MSQFILALTLVIGFALQAHAAPAHIIILRHGEKISDEERNLSPKGYKRAEALATYFSDTAFRKAYGKPAAFFAASPGKKSSLRSVETISPAAQALNMIVDASYNKDDGETLMQAILNDESYDGKTVVICWNRAGMNDLLAPLEGEFPSRWSDKVFDRFWVLDMQLDGTYSFKSIPQDLLPGDSTTLAHNN